MNKQQLKDELIKYSDWYYSQTTINISMTPENKLIDIYLSQLPDEQPEKGKNSFVRYDSIYNYHEDYTHENGNYINSCLHCGREFLGSKYRRYCKVCVNTQIRQPEETGTPFDENLNKKP